MARTVVIDSFPESAAAYHSPYAIVAVDVIRATTMAVTAVALGRRCFPVSTVQEAFSLAKRLDRPVLAGELGGIMPAGFEMSNSPADLIKRTDIHRPLILLSSSGTQLIARARGADAVYVACFRNVSATARTVGKKHSRVAVIGAGSRGEFREEDQMCCAWVAQQLIEDGYVAQNQHTQELVRRWKGCPPDACADGNSAKYLRNSGQLRDLDFILERIDDLEGVFALEMDEIIPSPTGELITAQDALMTCAASGFHDANSGGLYDAN